MLVEVFKAGTWTDSAGNTRTWTEEDLDKIVEKYNSQKEHEAPIVIGHPKDNDPAFGWVESIERRGQSIWAKIKPTVQEFVDWVKQGLYKKVSISLYPDLLLRHVGFLGAVPPAVKGLKTAEFSDNEYSELQFDVEIKDIDFKEVKMSEKDNELEKQLKEKERMLYEFAEREKAKEEEIAKLKAELEAERARQRKAEFASFCDKLIEAGKLTPAMKSLVIDFMEILHGSGDYEFSEGDGKEKAKPVEKFKTFLAGLPKVVEFNEFATKNRAADMKTDLKKIDEMTGWDLIDLYREDKSAFDEMVKKI